MAESQSVMKGSNGDVSDDLGRPIEISADADTLPAVLRDYVAGVLSSGVDSPPLIQRIRSSASKSAPRLRVASRNSARDLLLWTRRGSPLRALLVISVGSITLLALTGLLFFMFILFVATVNAIIISLIMSLAAAGGFLALFFTSLAAIYIGALSVAAFIISTTTISIIIAVMIATGWIGFFWIIFFAAQKSLDVTKQSINMTSSAISAYSAARQITT
ncbi:uncharacterized protein [Typha latifolia]|uniref:uncharacterized protein n=1 Tax=Typha latifolia TaxID=4733 RepID=UPI003C30260E